MKITIDTKEDSHEDIRKVLQLLSSITANHSISANHSIPVQENTDTTSMMGMFADTSTTGNSTFNNNSTFNSSSALNSNAIHNSTMQSSAGIIPDTAPDFSSFLNLVNKGEKKRDNIPKIEFF